MSPGNHFKSLCSYTGKNIWARFDTDCREASTGWSLNRARKVLTASYRHWGYMSIRAVRQTPYISYEGTAPTEHSDTVIPYRIAHVYVLESGLNFWPCTDRSRAADFMAKRKAKLHFSYLYSPSQHFITLPARFLCFLTLPPPHPSADRSLQGVRGCLLSVLPTAHLSKRKG